MTTEKKPEAETKTPAKKSLSQGDKLDLVIATLKANGISLPAELDDED